MSLRSDHSIGPDTRATVAFRLDQYVKRAFDIAAAMIGLIVFSPILLISAVAIKLRISWRNFYPRASVRQL